MYSYVNKKIYTKKYCRRRDPLPWGRCSNKTETTVSINVKTGAPMWREGDSPQNCWYSTTRSLTLFSSSLSLKGCTTLFRTIPLDGHESCAMWNSTNHYWIRVCQTRPQMMWVWLSFDFCLSLWCSLLSIIFPLLWYQDTIFSFFIDHKKWFSGLQYHCTVLTILWSCAGTPPTLKCLHWRSGWCVVDLIGRRCGLHEGCGHGYDSGPVYSNSFGWQLHHCYGKPESLIFRGTLLRIAQDKYICFAAWIVCMHFSFVRLDVSATMEPILPMELPFHHLDKRAHFSTKKFVRLTHWLLHFNYSLRIRTQTQGFVVKQKLARQTIKEDKAD